MNPLRNAFLTTLLFTGLSMNTHQNKDLIDVNSLTSLVPSYIEQSFIHQDSLSLNLTDTLHYYWQGDFDTFCAQLSKFSESTMLEEAFLVFPELDLVYEIGENSYAKIWNVFAYTQTDTVGHTWRTSRVKPSADLINRLLKKHKSQTSTVYLVHTHPNLELLYDKPYGKAEYEPLEKYLERPIFSSWHNSLKKEYGQAVPSIPDHKNALSKYAALFSDWDFQYYVVEQSGRSFIQFTTEAQDAYVHNRSSLDNLLHDVHQFTLPDRQGFGNEQYVLIFDPRASYDLFFEQ